MTAQLRTTLTYHGPSNDEGYIEVEEAEGDVYVKVRTDTDKHVIDANLTPTEARAAAAALLHFAAEAER